MLQEGTGMIDLEALFGTQRSRATRGRATPRMPCTRRRDPDRIDPDGAATGPAGPAGDEDVTIAGRDGLGGRHPVSGAATLNTSAVRLPRSVATVVITALAVVALAAIVYVMAARGGKATPAASVAGSGSSAALPTVTHIDDPKLKPVVVKPAAPAQPPPASATPAAPRHETRGQAEGRAGEGDGVPSRRSATDHTADEAGGEG